MVSVIAVKIQFSSPSIVFLSVKSPGIFSINLAGYLSFVRVFMVYQRRDVCIGVVRQQVNKSAGNSGC